ncbi:MAG: transposase, partial [Anaerolineae bacterium]
MSIVILQLPKVKRESSERPKQCRYCKGEILQRWGRAEKRVRDTQVRRVKFHRYRCTNCRRTFRHYPEGVSRARQTERLKLLAVVCWSFGLSHRKAGLVLSAF